ncbi:GNAT family N-acetyltransferase [Halomonas sp. GD1P12]|uniref:GNAT family N-acetyltransferase n=1 Tax=Halomonas sp. GD1P12 TaxID=2982691 RepID=UPI0021E3F824|nr:GNAT family N-acetyltransferase [Halomonas sp. GD1P12]UYG01276.1 GNAT family N-acetyltransferase [Halomonas sp. GD1P12]
MRYLETHRLRLRPLSLNDLSALTSILGDPEVMKYSMRGVFDEVATRQFIEWCCTCYAAHGMGPMALVEKDTNLLIGFCGVSPEEIGGVEEIMLGYRLAARYWNQGFAPEAVKAVLDQAFNEKSLPSVVALIEPEHTASQKVAAKAGFDHFEIQEYHGCTLRMYRQTREQWCSSKGNMTESGLAS